MGVETSRRDVCTDRRDVCTDMSIYAFFIFLLKYVHQSKEREAKFYLGLYIMECLVGVVIIGILMVKTYLIVI